MYEKINFKDRVVERPMTFNIITNDDGTVTLEPVTGEVYEEGTEINSTNMEHIEEGILNLNKNVFIKDNYAVLEGTITLPEADESSLTGSTNVNYPTGFNKDNCIIVSLMAQKNNTKNGFSTTQHASAGAFANGTSDLRASLREDFIQLAENKISTSQGSSVIDFKIALLKYKD